MEKINSKKAMTFCIRVFLISLSISAILLLINLFYAPFVLRFLWIISSWITKGLGVISLVCFLIYLYDLIQRKYQS